jgi:type VI secretion system secreted protein VgrG
MSASRTITVKTPLPENELLFYKASIVEQLGQPFDIQLDLLSPNEALDLEALLGKEICIEVGLPSGDSRYFHAYIAHASQLGRHGEKAAYQVRAVPWLWFLTRTTDCRIYQNQSALQIAQAIFREHGFTDFRESLVGSYRTRDYCVQYRESDFNFVQRLLEEEGIYYFFEHTSSTHTLVFADASGAHDSPKGYATIPYYSSDGAMLSEREHIYEWQLSREVQSGKQVLTDYDFTKPRAVLKTQHVVKRKSAKSDFELFDYPGGYTKTKDEGDNYVRSRLEAVQARFERVNGKGSVRGIGAGSLFSLENHPRQDQNKKYLVVGATHTIHGGDYESGLGNAEPVYACSFEAMDVKEVFRSLPTAPKPRVGGPQTATVVGQGDEEIWTDKYGRVKVQFHWDRLGDRNENSSCWVRVSQVWAGQNFGWMSIPRVKQEVVVDFLEGDPDRPLITGRVYNQDNMPPYELPENKTQSGVKTRSSKDGTAANFNEIRFEDKKGAEQLYIHAEKNQDVVVKNDASVSIGNDRSETIKHDERIEIGNDRTHSVGGKLSLTVDKSESHIVKDARSTSVAKDDELSVGKNLKISAADSVTIVAGSASIALKKDGTVVIKGKEITFDGTKINLKASGDITLKGSKVKQN